MSIRHAYCIRHYQSNLIVMLILNARPIMHRGHRRCFLSGSETTSVNLYLPEWADNVHPTDLIDSEMDPWLNIVNEAQLFECMRT